MSASITDQQVTTLQTANATPGTVASYAHPDGSGSICKAVVVAVDSAGNTKGWEMNLVVKRVAGVLAVVGALQTLMTAQGDVALSSALAVITTSGSNVIVQVTGILATTINWRVRFIVDTYTP